MTASLLDVILNKETNWDLSQFFMSATGWAEEQDWMQQTEGLLQKKFVALFTRFY